jgi:hypothetical protein
VADVPPDYWHLAQNVRLKDNQAEATRRIKEVYNAASPGAIVSKVPRAMHFIEDQVGNCHWIVATATSVAGLGYIMSTPADASFAWTDRTPAAFAGALPDKLNCFSFCSFNQRVVMNCRNNAPGYWNPTAGGLFLPLPGWFGGGEQCYSVRAYKQWLVALNFNAPAAQPSRVSWSVAAAAFGVPTTWVAAATNDAGTTYLGDNTRPLIDGQALGDGFFIFGERDIYRMVWVGGDAVMGFDRLSASVGVSGLNCISRVDNELFVLGSEDIYAVNEAGQIRSLAEGQVRRTILAEVEQAGSGGGSFVAYNATSNEWIVFVGNPAGVTIRNAWVLNVATGRWTQSRFAETGNTSGVTAAASGPAGEYALATPTRIPASGGVLIGKPNSGLTDHVLLSLDCPQAATSNYTVLDQVHQLQRKEIDFGDPDRRKLITGIRLVGQYAATEAFSITITSRATRDGTGTSNGPYTFTAATSDRVDCLVEGRFFDVSISNTPLNTLDPWKVSGFDIEYELAGRF